MLTLAGFWVLVNAASVTHSAWAFAQLERSGYWWIVGLVAAVGTDAGMAALTWIAMERRRDGGSLWWPVLGVVLAGAAVAFANVDHALGVAGAWATLTPWVKWRVVVLSLVLPALTVLMSALVEGEHASAHVPVKTKRTRKAKDETSAAVEPEVSTRALASDEDDEPAELPPVRAHAPPQPGMGDERIEAVRAHVAAHPDATDVQIDDATGVPRATVGRWRRRGLLDVSSAPTIERNGAVPAHTREA
ncbi:MAG: hypothetical protein ABI780_01835 [Ardenticatenales bacterium]